MAPDLSLTVSITHLARRLTEYAHDKFSIITIYTWLRTNSEWRSFEMPCILAECWTTRSNRLARETA